MDEIERLRVQLAVEQIVDDQFDVGDFFLLQEGTRRVEHALIDVGAHDLAGRADPLAEDPKPAHGSAADVQGASAGSAAELREELAPGWLPHERLQPQALQLRGLVGQQVVLLRHRPQYPPFRPAGKAVPSRAAELAATTSSITPSSPDPLSLLPWERRYSSRYGLARQSSTTKEPA